MFRRTLPLAADAAASGPLKRTALYEMHKHFGGKIVPFAGWEMPLQYADLGIGASTLHTRQEASLFDVSHMLQSRLWGKDREQFMEYLTVADVRGLPVDFSTLSVFTNKNGGIVDDTIINKQADHLYVVSNAGCAEKDIKNIGAQLEIFLSKGGRDCSFEIVKDKSLLALQGPKSARNLELLTGKSLADFSFMTTRKLSLRGIPCHVSRSGYTGEDGFEIQVASSQAVQLAEMLLQQPGIKWAGLGARDSLRLEAGMCLYGHDLDDTTSPVEASLSWTIAKRRRAEGGFIGADIILRHLKEGVSRRRVGLIVEGAPAREGAEILSIEDEKVVGKITSGCPSPSLKQNIAMGYVKTGYHKNDIKVLVKVRQKLQPATITKMPFVETRYHK